MKTGKEIQTMWFKDNFDVQQSWQAIADAWNADLNYYEEQTERSAIVYDKLFDRYEKARKQLRKLRQELAEAKGLAGVYFHQKEMHMDTISRLESLIERIAKGKR